MQQSSLLDLPNDVLRLIANCLFLDNLFTPRYEDDDFDFFGGLSKYTKKREEYYGTLTDDLDQRAQGLLSWSVSNKHFRAFLAPYLFKTIVLRDRPKSSESVKSLMRTPYWDVVINLIFATTESSSNEMADKHGDEEDKDTRADSGVLISENEGFQAHESVERSGTEDAKSLSTAENLRAILSHLPSNLQCLTIDLPEVREGFGYSPEESMSDADSYGEVAYRHTLKNVFASISSNDISDKNNFELRLYNFPPYKCDVCESKHWRKFMSNITSFILSLKHYDNGAGWKMNMHAPAIGIAPLLGKLLWNHFDRIQSFVLNCDESWPLGGPDDLCRPLDLPLPSSRTWKSLRHVSFKETFICPQLLKFLQAHLKTIETVELVDCFAPDYCEYNDPGNFDIMNYDGIRWDSLFKGLAEVRPSNLRDLSISNVSRSQGDLIDSYIREKGAPEWEQHKDQVREIMREQQLELADAVRGSKSNVRIFQKLLLAHVALDHKLGTILNAEEENVYKFLDGKYHKRYLELVAVMLENSGLT